MKIIISCLLLLSTITTEAQVKVITIRDGKDGAVIPFATVKVLHTPKGEIANEKGEVMLEVSPSDTILITSVGYSTRRILGAELNNILMMERKTDSLEHILVRATAPIRTIILGNGVPYLEKNIKCRCSPDCNLCWPWSSANLKEEFAERIDLPDSSKAYKLKRIFVPTRTKDAYGPLLIRIYEIDETTGKPGEELFVKLISVSKKNVKRSKVNFDLTSEDFLVHNSKGFYISVSWPPGIAKNQKVTIIGLFEISKNNSFERHLRSTTYEWGQIGFRPQGKKTGTAYAVEVEERVYR